MITPGGVFYRNPVMLKELRSRMRGGRAFLILSIYLLLLGGTVSLIFVTFFADQTAAASANVRQTLGKTLFGVVVGMQLLTVAFISPALTAGAISGEREHLTFDLVRTTLLSARQFVVGKLLSALSFLVLVLFAAFPLQSLAFFFGGVALEEILISAVLVVASAIGFSSLGLFFSSFSKRTLISTISSYGATILLIFGVPILLLIGVSIVGNLTAASLRPLPPLLEVTLALIGWFLVSINPLATAVATEIILIEEQSVFLFTLPLSSGSQFLVPSPWISFTAICLLISAMLIAISIRFVRRVEK